MDEAPPPIGPDTETAHTIGRKSARNPRIEVITRGERRRVWTPEQKREIVAESLEPGLTPTEVARKHASSSGQLYTWRQQVLGGQITLLARATPDFAQVEMTPVPPPSGAPFERPNAAVTSRHLPEMIEVVLTNGVILRVGAAVDAAALGRVLAALERR
jgi:transposase